MGHQSVIYTNLFLNAYRLLLCNVYTFICYWTLCNHTGGDRISIGFEVAIYVRPREERPIDCHVKAARLCTHEQLADELTTLKMLSHCTASKWSQNRRSLLMEQFNMHIMAIRLIYDSKHLAETAQHRLFWTNLPVLQRTQIVLVQKFHKTCIRSVLAHAGYWLFIIRPQTECSNKLYRQTSEVRSNKLREQNNYKWLKLQKRSELSKSFCAKAKHSFIW